MKVRYFTRYRVFNNRVTKCYLTAYVDFEDIDIPDYEQSYEAISKCHADDTFDKVTGERIAESKAVLKMRKDIINILSKYYAYAALQATKSENDLMAAISDYEKEENHLKELINK